MKLTNKQSLTDLNARDRVHALLDENTCEELLGPFDGIESPHLPAQGIVPQSDDGVVIGKGLLEGKRTVIIATEGQFQGGGIGEVAGAKIAGALELALRDNQNGLSTQVVLVLDTGGVRLQEANYGLLTIAEIHAAIIALREYVPVIGIIPGKIGVFGGMAISAGLCSKLIMTKEGRMCLNGPEVIEQEAGITELDSSDRRLVWRVIGGEQRVKTNLADALSEDDIDSFKAKINALFTSDSAEEPRSRQIYRYRQIVNQHDPSKRIQPEIFREITHSNNSSVQKNSGPVNQSAESRGEKWFEVFTGKNAAHMEEIPSVLYGSGKVGEQEACFLAVVPNAEAKYRRATDGEFGLEEGWKLAEYINSIVEEDKNSLKRPIVAVVDTPSQAYGYNEEMAGIHLSCAAAVDAYATARMEGHPIITLIVGKAISGAFLSHGMQGNRIIALDDDHVQVQVMSKESAARVTLRTVEEVERASETVPATGYDIHSFKKLGALDELVHTESPGTPDVKDKELIEQHILSQLADVQEKGLDINHRWKTAQAVKEGRIASINVREKMEEQWI
ncbi:biotin-independent malonate decarboxylase subunit beta [Marinococcus halophilus]|uniref:Biotin-independent malonate decarboxylase subunit beta n=1 Tax=Marinococcus halophilus TaxID=1371 RepID=A0A510Y8Z1_MARHA|nr:biotin-independent malonate decarboxylase subunit beta [Marinococcus halophilus]OZT79177.1 biotin-independent malonate decarboxylase subunit beta [Marinococcus halophilus]GEK59840.1 biotin-independent malonate decarboxylase subunit beta [Marinococcus halophilus]